MSLIYKKLPAVLLAVIMAAALSLTAGLSAQPAHAATADNTYFVYLETEDGTQTALPGGSIKLNAQVWHDFAEYDLSDQSNVDFYWTLSQGAEYASITPDEDNDSAATVTFDPMSEEMAAIDGAVMDETVTAEVFLYIDGKKVDSDQMELTVSSDYIQLYPQIIPRDMMIGDTAVVTTSVNHITLDDPEGTPVENVTFKWTWYDEGDLKIEDASGKSEATGSIIDFNMTRLTGEPIFIELEATWENGEAYTSFMLGAITTDLDEYYINFPELEDGYDAIVDEGGSITPEVQVMRWEEDGTPVYLRDDKYTLSVEKYLGYDEEKGEPIFEAAAFPLTYDENEEPGIYRVRATAAEGSGFTGSTSEDTGFIFVTNRNSLSYYTASVEFKDSYLRFPKDDPYVRYEVTPGTVLIPRVTAGSEKLTSGTDYTVEYVNNNTGETQATFPKAVGEYTCVVTGTGTYHGTIESMVIKVGKVNPMTVKAKNVKAKAKKKTVIKKTKAFNIKSAKGSVYFEKISGNSKISVASNGKITVKKGLKKGKSYPVQVRVVTDGNDTYLQGEETVTVKVKVTK